MPKIYLIVGQNVKVGLKRNRLIIIFFKLKNNEIIKISKKDKFVDFSKFMRFGLTDLFHDYYLLLPF